MHYEYGGQIQVWDTPKGVDAIREAVDQIVADEEEYGDCTEYIRYITELLKIRVNEGGEIITADSNMEALKKLMELYPELSVQRMGRWTKEVLNKDAYVYLIEQGIAKSPE